MPATYEPIATTTLGSAAATIDFTSIPSTFTDLTLIVVFKGASGSVTCYARANADSGSNYSVTNLEGNGSSAGSYSTSGANGFFGNWSQSAGTTNSHFVKMDIFSYAGSTFKTALAEASADENGSGGLERNVSLWRSTAAINQLTVRSANSGSFAIGTTATLYGIKNA